MRQGGEIRIHAKLRERSSPLLVQSQHVVYAAVDQGHQLWLRNDPRWHTVLHEHVGS